MRKWIAIVVAVLAVPQVVPAAEAAGTLSTPEAPVEAPAPRMPFAHGEKLLYEVSFLGVTAGQAELRAENARDDEWRFFASGRTVGATDSIFGLRQSASCTVHGEKLKPELCLFTSQQRKGLKRREVRYDHATGEVSERLLEDGKRSEKKRNFGDEGIHEGVSGLYLLRKEFPAIGETMSFRAIRKGKAITVEAEALGRETVKTDAGTFDVVAVDLRIITKVDKDAATHARVWFTDDVRRLPVKVAVDAPVGSLVATLVAASGTLFDAGLARQ